MKSNIKYLRMKQTKRGARSRAHRKEETNRTVTDDILEEWKDICPSVTPGFTIKEPSWTEKQQDFLKIAMRKSTKIMFINGPAGTAKTLLSVYCGLKNVQFDRSSGVIYLRSAVESSDRHLGALPGDADEKLGFYNLPFFDKLDELIGHNHAGDLMKSGLFSTFPVNFARGMSWNNKFIILDEAQNSSKKEIVTILTRLGEGSKCFVLADPMQTDLRDKDGGAFSELYNKFLDCPEAHDHGVYSFRFTEDDIMRSELVRFLVKKLQEPTNSFKDWRPGS